MCKFEKSFDFSMGIEKGTSNRKLNDDPGGLTKYGISKRYHPEEWVLGPPTLESAKKFYRREFWDKLRLEEVDWPACLLVFDFAINSGSAIHILQQKLPGLMIDGVMGTRTISALNIANRDHERLTLLNVARIRYIMELVNWEANANGWLKRVLLLQSVIGEHYLVP